MQWSRLSLSRAQPVPAQAEPGSEGVAITRDRAMTFQWYGWPDFQITLIVCLPAHRWLPSTDSTMRVKHIWWCSDPTLARLATNFQEIMGYLMHHILKEIFLQVGKKGSFIGIRHCADHCDTYIVTVIGLQQITEWVIIPKEFLVQIRFHALISRF